MKTNFKILIVEDSDSYRETVIQLLGVYNDISGVASLAQAREALNKSAYEVVILDRNLPDGDSLELIPQIRRANPGAVIVILTIDKDFGSVKKCIAAGADDYVIKGENVVADLLVRIPLAVARAATERKLESLQDQVREAFRYEIIGKSISTIELREKIASLKATGAHVLITGESGTGKELIARRIHAIEDEPKGSFVPVNCGAIPENLVESELFGHKRGSFTSASTNQRGKFEEANGGVIFLDEIGDLPLQAQTKLLRVIEDGQLFRVGDSRPIQIKCRVVAATNKSLEELIQQKRFRADLFHRLNVINIVTTPLRRRIEDLPAITDSFVLHLGGSKFTIADTAAKRLLQHDWPGNVRELRNTIERAIIAAKQRKSTKIEHEDISIHQPLDGPNAGVRRIEVAIPTELKELSGSRYNEFLEIAEREYLKSALIITGNNVANLSALLGVSRSTIFKKMKKLDIDRRPYGVGEADEFEDEQQNDTSVQITPPNQQPEARW